jgi:hypothetical protein
MELLSALDAFPRRTVSTVHDREVYRIKSRSWISSVFASTSEENERLRFVNILRDRLPFVLLWLDDVLIHEIREGLEEPVSSCDGAGFWVVSQSVSMNAMLPKLFEGGWGMFFFRARPHQMPQPPIPLMPSRRPVANELFGSTGAQAILVSEYDDRDWLFAVNAQS